MLDDDRVFKALGDPTRRLLLDRLFSEDGRSLGELEAKLRMTRFGVMKHLRVLEEAGLVVSRKAGRRRLHYLNPVPIRQIHDHWIHKYTARRASTLIELKDRLEKQAVTARTELQTRQVYQVFIKASPQTIWNAITRPEFTVQYFHRARLENTAERHTAYGPNGEIWGDEAVREYEPPRRLVHGWRSLYSPESADEAESRVTWEIEPQEGGYCKLTVVHDELEGRPRRRRTSPARDGCSSSATSRPSSRPAPRWIRRRRLSV